MAHINGNGGGGVQPLAPLLMVKLAPPALPPGVLPRPDVVEPLVDGAEQLALISAPAGWGKTSLLAEWLGAEQGRRSTAFLRLDEGDDAGPLFWSYLIAALRTVHPGLAAGADTALRSPEADPMRQVVPSLLNELTEADSDLVLVLDDYHVISRSDIHESVGYLIDHLPPSLRLAISTRADPPLSLSRLRASGNLVELRAGDLAFSVAETAEFLRRRFGVDLDYSDAEALRRRTEGWPAAVQLAGLSLHDSEDPSGFIARFAGDDRNVADYLIGVALGSVSGTDREFLVRTSVLDQMTGSLCDEVAGVTDAAATLDRMERGGLFLVPLDSRRNWYRYHRLFGDWLRHELRRTNPDLIAPLHLTAAEWYAKNGSLEQAVSHALKAGDATLAARYADRYLADWTHVQWSLARKWFQQLPEDVIRAFPLVAVGCFQLALAEGDFESGARWIDAAEAALADAPASARPAIETTVALYKAFGELVAGDMNVALAASEAIADRERPAKSADYARAVGLAGMATFWAIGPLEAIPLLLEGSAARRKALVGDGGVTALLALAYAEVGDHSAAEDAAMDAFSIPEPPAWMRYPERMAAHYALGKVLAARGEPARGIDQIRKGLSLARGWVEPIFIAYGCLVLADTIGEYAEKRSLVREARQFIEGPRGRGRIRELVVAAERKLALRRPRQQTAGTVHVEPLTERELEVLRFLKSDLSLREIAAELFISHNTIKSYTKAIYRKLGVTSRSAAVDATTDLDLI